MDEDDRQKLFINAIKNNDIESFDKYFPDNPNFTFAYEYYHGYVGDNVPLYLAISLSNNEFVMKLINADANVNYIDIIGFSLLMAAYAHRDYDIIDILLISGADPNIRHNKFGYTALHLAIRCGSSDDYINKLLNAGADPNIKDCYNRTPLFYSISIQTIQSKEIFLRFLELTTDLNITDSEDKTMLYIAFMYDKFFVFEKLLAAGADPNIVNNKGESLFQIINNFPTNNDRVTHDRYISILSSYI